MAQERLPMRKIRDVLRLSAAGLSKRQIAASLGIGPTAAGACLRRAREAGLSWPLPDDLTTPRWRAASIRSVGDHGQGLAVAAGLAGDPSRVAPQGRDAAAGLGGVPRRASRRLRPQPVLRTLSGLGRPAVADDAAGARGRREAVRRLCRHDDRQSSTRTTGEVHDCQLFVAALGASSFTYAEATFTQTLPDWIGSHTRAFGIFRRRAGDGRFRQSEVRRHQGLLLRAGASIAAYAEMAAHYDTAIVPARPRKPRDKAKVEVAVQVATRWIIAKLRNVRFFSLVELNAGDP